MHEIGSFVLRTPYELSDLDKLWGRRRRQQKSKQEQSAAERSGSALGSGYTNQTQAKAPEYAEYPQDPRKYEMDAQPVLGPQLQKHELDSSDTQR